MPRLDYEQSSNGRVAKTSIGDDYTWDMARQDKDLLRAAKRFYSNTEKRAFEDDNELFDYMVSDRRWKDSNTWSTLKELDAVKGGLGGIKDYTASEEDLEDLSVIRSRWEKLPGGIERIGKGIANADVGEVWEGTKAVAENVGKGMLDPTIFAGGPIGKGVGAAVNVGAKAVGREAIKQGTKTALKVGTGMALDAAVSGGANLAYQEANVELGLQKEVDKFSAIAAGGLGLAASGAGHLMAHKPSKSISYDPKLLAEQATAQAEAIRKARPDTVDLRPGTETTNIKARQKEIDAIIDEGFPDLPNVSVEEAKKLSPETVVKLKDKTSLEHTLASQWNLPLPKLETASKEIYDYISGRMVNLNATEDKVALIRDLKGKFGEYFIGTNDRIGTTTFKEIEKAARKGLDGKPLMEAAEDIKNLPEGYGFNSVEMMAARVVQAGLYKKFDELGAALLKAGDDPKIAREMQHAMDAWKDITPLIEAGKSETGRTLASLRYTPMSPEKVFGKTMDTLKGRMQAGTMKAGENVAKGLNLVAGGESKFANQSELMMNTYKAIKTLGDDPLKLDLFLMNVNKEGGGLSDQLWEAWYNSLLSSPSTMLINATGNVVTNTMYLLERSAALAIEGKNPSYLLAGYFNSIPEAWKVASTTFKTEIPWDEATRRELGDSTSIPSFRRVKDEDGFMRWRKAGVGEPGSWGGKQARLPGRALMMMDDFNKFTTYRAHLVDVAGQEAKAQGLKGDALKKYVADFVANPPASVHAEAKELGRLLTFTDDPGTIVRSIMQITEDVPLARAFIPFVRTPANIMAYAASMTPGAHYLSKRTMDDLAAGGVRQRQAQVRLLMGTSLITMGAWMNLTGNSTAGGPANPSERQTWMSSNLPWAVKAGNQWIQYNRLDPVAIPFAAGAAFGESLKLLGDDDREASYWTTMASLFSDAVLDKTWFQGVQNIIQVTTDPERYGDSVMNGLVRTLVPSVLAGSTRAWDPVVLAPQTFMEVINDRMRFDRRELVPPKLDRYGREVTVETLGADKDATGPLAFAARLAVPFKTKTAETDPVALEMQELRIDLAAPAKKWKGVELDSNQYYVYDKSRSQYIYNGVKYAMSFDGWKKLDPGVKRMIVDEIRAEATQSAAQILTGVYPELSKIISRPDVLPKAKKFLEKTKTEAEKEPLLDFRANPAFEKMKEERNKTPLTTPPKKDIIGSLGVDVIDSQNPGVTYDPITQQLTRGPGVSDEDVASLVKGKDSKWKEQTIKVKLEDGRTVDVSADKASKIMKSKLTKARKMMEELDAT